MKTGKLILLCLMAFLLSDGIVLAQGANHVQKLFSSAILEISGGSAYLDDFIHPQSGVEYPLFENSVHAALLINLFGSKHFKAGLQFNYLWTRFNHQNLDNYYILGVMARYDYPISGKFRLFGDLGLNTGNYCDCLEDESVETLPFKKDNIYYLGLKGGIAYEVVRPVWIYLGIAAYDELIKEPPFAYGYVQPLVGLQIHFE
jgi:hypothetical protein